MERYEEAITEYTAALRLAPNEATSLYGRGLAYLKRFNRVDSAKDMAEAVKIDGQIAEKFRKWGVPPPT